MKTIRPEHGPGRGRALVDYYKRLCIVSNRGLSKSGVRSLYTDDALYGYSMVGVLRAEKVYL